MYTYIYIFRASAAFFKESDEDSSGSIFFVSHFCSAFLKCLTAQTIVVPFKTYEGDLYI